MTFYFAMTNSWSLLYDEIYGEDTMTEDIRITSLESDEYDPIVGSGNTAATFITDYNDGVDLNSFDNISINTAECPEGISVTNIPQSSNSEDTIHISTKADSTYIFESPDGGKTVTRRGINASPEDREVICGDYFGDNFPYVGDAILQDMDTLNINIDTSDYPPAFTTLSDNDDSIAHHITTPTPGIELDNPRKYKEDEAIKALQDYISTTYGGHYTSKENNVQTLDLIESVGDAESFCRSNAIKYLSRYDKKGQAKRDILKALHYTLLLYHFSGQLKETTTRGYETF